MIVEEDEMLLNIEIIFFPKNWYIIQKDLYISFMIVLIIHHGISFPMINYLCLLLMTRLHLILMMARISNG